MKKEEFLERWKKCFGKEKDTRYHSFAMAMIYTIFLVILILIIRFGETGNSESFENTNIPTPTPSITPNEETTEELPQNDFNYSYSYTITYQGVNEFFLGKKIDEKEKFTQIKDGIMTDYAVLNGNYFILENGVYHLSEKPNRFLKYCDTDIIFQLIENQIPAETETGLKYTVTNSEIGSFFAEELSIDNGLTNIVSMTFANQVLKTIDLDFSNYYSSVQGSNLSLIIHMEFVDIGTTENFEIPLE